MNLGRITCALSLIIGGLKCFDALLDVLVSFFACHYILPFFKGDLGRNVTPSENQNCFLVAGTHIWGTLDCLMKLKVI